MVLAHRVLERDEAAARVVRGQPQAVGDAGLGERPADDLEQAAADERVLGAALARCCAGVSRPLAPLRDGSVAGSLSSPSIRATSSIRSASRVTSERRKCGTATANASPSVLDAELERPQDLGLALARGSSRPSSCSVRARAQRDRLRVRARPADVDRARLDASRRTARSSASSRRPAPPSAARGDRPFSKRALASLRRPSRVEVWWIVGASQAATSSRTRVVSSPTSDRAPPMTPASDVGPSASSMTISPSSSVRVWPSSVSIVSPCARGAHGEPLPGDPVEVERVQRLAGQEHHVVRDVDDVRDRALAGGGQARLEPRRRRADLHVLEHARGEARAQVGDLDGHRRLAPPRRTSRGRRPTAAAASGAPVVAWTSRAMP